MIFKHESVEFVKVSPDVLTKTRLNKFTGNDNDGYVNLQGSKTSKKKKLLVVAPATHAARLTNNNALYQPRRMVKDIESFVNPFPKPVLIEHESKLPPIGRVVQASYESLAHHFLQDPAEMFDEKDTFKLIKFLMTTGLVYQDDFPGVGQAVLSMEITDEQAIERFLDNRYLTFSIRVASNEILDPHTGLPFAELDPLTGLPLEDNPPEGKYSPYLPGQIVDGLPGFVVLDRMKYKEVSPVNLPADEHAIVRSIQEMNFSDSEHKSKSKAIKVDGSYKIELISNEIIKLGDVKNMPPEDLNKTVLPDPKVVEDANIKPKTLASFDHITDQSSADQIYDAMAIVLDEMLAEGVIKEDAKLTTEQRKALPASSYCGPSKSFPANDCSHVTAARRLIGRAKLSDSQKTRILACVDRKAKQMSCDADSCVIVTTDSLVNQINDLSDFDFQTIMDSILGTSRDRGISVEDSMILKEIVDSSNPQTANKVLESKLKELEAEKNVLIQQIDSLTSDTKSYVSLANVLMKVFKDNLKIQSIDDAIASEKSKELSVLKTDAEVLVKDEKLIKKVQDYLNGFAINNVLDANVQVDNPVAGGPSVKNDNNDSWIEKTVRTQFESLKLSDSEQAAIAYARAMAANEYVNNDFAKVLIDTCSIKQNN